MGKDGRGWEWREGIVHVGGEDISEATYSASPGLEVCEGSVAGLPISLDEAVDIQGVYVVEEGTIL